MASDKRIKIEKVVDLGNDDLIKGDPGRPWVAPQKPAPAAPPNTEATPKPSADTNSNNTSGSKS